MLPNQGKVTNNICNMFVTSIRICFFLTFLQAFSHFSRGTFPCFLHFSRGTFLCFLHFSRGTFLCFLHFSRGTFPCILHFSRGTCPKYALFCLYKIRKVGCWRTGHGGPCSTLVCMANLSRTVASVPRPPASNVIYPLAPQRNPSSILKNINKLWVAGGRGTETTVLL